MSQTSKVHVDTKVLDRMIKMLRGVQPGIKIGVLGEGSRKDGGNNAAILAAHEMGTSSMPRRSVIADPISDELPKKLKTAKIDKQEVKSAVRKGSIKVLMERVAGWCDDIIQKGFDTAGYGKWAPLAPSTLKNKSTDQILIETTQMRQAITVEVSE